MLICAVERSIQRVYSESLFRVYPKLAPPQVDFSMKNFRETVCSQFHLSTFPLVPFYLPVSTCQSLSIGSFHFSTRFVCSTGPSLPPFFVLPVSFSLIDHKTIRLASLSSLHFSPTSHKSPTSLFCRSPSLPDHISRSRLASQ